MYPVFISETQVTDREDKRMFKKCLAFVLCLILAAALTLPAMAENTQLTKLQGQWKSSAFRGTLTGEVTGEASKLTDPETWAAIKALFAANTLSISHTVKDSQKNEGDESVLTLTNQAGTEIARLNILTDAAGVIYLQSDLLDEGGLYYAFDSGFDWSAMLLPGDNAWPSLLHVISEVSRASQTWQEQAKPYMEQFSLNISRWLQSYVTTSTEQKVNGAYVTIADYELPVAAVMQETRALLVDFYRNSSLLSLLAQVMTAEEQAAYLQPSMTLPFLQMLDNVKLSGNISVHRQYETSSGDVLYDSISVPFPEGLPVRSLTLVHVPNAEGGELWQLKAVMDAEQLGIAYEQTITIDIAAQNTDTDVWTGSALALLNASTDPESLNQEDQTLFSCTYNLNAPAPKDTNDFYQSRYERRYEATLVVKPDESMGLPSFSLGGSFVIYSKSSTPSSTCYVESTVSLTDLDQESAITLNFSGKTPQRWTPPMLTDAISSALRMDMMSTQSRLELLTELFDHFVKTLAARVIQ